MPTANSIIERALVKARVIAPGESIPSGKANQILDELNDMLESWSLENFMVPCETEESFTLVAGQQEYTYGPSGDFDSARPLEIRDETYIRSGETDYHLRLFPLDTFRRVKNKFSEGDPELVAYSPEQTQGRVYIWPIPSLSLVDSYILSANNTTIYTGTGTFGGPSGVSVSIGATLSGSDYIVFIQPTSTDASTVGAISVNGKGTTSFTVYNTGADTSTTFDWTVIDALGAVAGASVSAGIDIYFRVVKELTQFSDLTTSVTLYPGYSRAIIANLAVEICPNFGKSPGSTLASLAVLSKSAIKSSHARPRRLLANPDLRSMLRGGMGYNILSGR